MCGQNDLPQGAASNVSATAGLPRSLCSPPMPMAPLKAPVHPSIDVRNEELVPFLLPDQKSINDLPLSDVTDSE
jgi:hypothetical protein